jgi:DNA-binding transcriptional LysR family regulator
LLTLAVIAKVGRHVLDMRRLGIFYAVTKHGSISAAARALYVTHSAVSQQVSLLERETGLSLLERTPRGVRVTEAGQVLADRCGPLLGAMSQLERDLDALRGRPTQIRLGAFPTAGGHIVPNVLREFLHRYPDSSVEYLPISVDEMADRVRDRTVHIGLVWDYEVAPRDFGDGVTVSHLFNDPLYVLLPADHPLAEERVARLDQFAEEQWIVRDGRPNFERAFRAMCRAAGFEPQIAWSAEDYQSAQGQVAAGLGISLVPRMSLTVRRGDVVAVPLEGSAGSRRIATLSPARAPMSQAANRLLLVIREQAASLSEQVVPRVYASQ